MDDSSDFYYYNQTTAIRNKMILFNLWIYLLILSIAKFNLFPRKQTFQKFTKQGLN